KIDKGCHDISRLRYVSFDHNAKIREDFDSIPIKEPSSVYLENKKNKQRAVSYIDPIEDADTENAFDAAVRRAERDYSFGDGFKHFFIRCIAGFCNVIGMSQTYCENMVLVRYGHQTNISDDNLLRPVRSIYKIYKSQHNTAVKRNSSNKLNDKITGAIVTQYIRKGVTPKPSDLSHLAESLQANIERVNEVADRVIEEYSEERDRDFHNTPDVVIREKKQLVQFWIIDEKDKITLDKRMFKEFLVNNGVYRYRVTIERWILVQVTDNVVKEINKADLKKIVTDYLESIRRFDIYQYIAQNVTKTFSDDYLELLPEASIKFVRDGKDGVTVFYQNGFTEITADGIVLKPYTELSGYIWESQILARKYKYIPNPACDFKTFVFHAAGKDSERYKSICSAIGYLMHDYKSGAYSPAVIFNDEVISDNPEGGTGKGILIKGIKNFKNTVSFDGKTFGFDKTFVYQRVNLDTKIMAFEDVNKNFDFERLFSVITDGIEVEKKNKGTFYIPFAESPKIIITTNYAIRGDGNSHDRRRFEIELARYYTKDYTPLDEFKRMLFDDWDEEEWQRFDSFMSECAKFYLKHGMVKQDLINLPEKRLIASTCQEFYDYMNEWLADNKQAPAGYYQKADMFNNFLSENKTFSKWLSNKKFYKWCAQYFEFVGLEFTEERTHDGRAFLFIQKTSDHGSD
ncbi:MAG TPA: primase-helicase family protein, partial [Sphingobacteriaceae bacterium]